MTLDVAEREFSFTDRDFNYIVNLVKEKTGIVLTDAKRQMVYSRLARRLRALQFDDFNSYCGLLKSGDTTELEDFVNAITTNLTAFFREEHHFSYLADTVIPELLRQDYAGKRIRVWSAGCSTGEEPYSISMVLKESVQESMGWDVRLLATDLDSNVLNTAKNGVYDISRVQSITPKRISRWFRKGKNSLAGKVKASDELKDIITFKKLNLMQEWPFRGPFDVIFCRNVVIYFDKDAQRKLVDRFAGKLRDGGYLFMGHSESLFRVTDRFSLIGNTIYRKVR